MGEAPASPESSVASAADVGKLVKEVRDRLGLTQVQLAAASGTSVPFIVDLEKGKETARLGMALHVLKMLGVRLVARS